MTLRISTDSEPILSENAFSSLTVSGTKGRQLNARGEGKMPTSTVDADLQSILFRRYVASLATKNADGTIHLTAVWYLFEDNQLLVATSSKTRKSRNIAARPQASMMFDIRKAGAERGVTATGIADLI